MAGIINPSKLAGAASEQVDYKKDIKEIIYPTRYGRCPK